MIKCPECGSPMTIFDDSHDYDYGSERGVERLWSAECPECGFTMSGRGKVPRGEDAQ